MNSAFYYVVTSFISDYEFVLRKSTRLPNFLLKITRTHSTVPTSIYGFYREPFNSHTIYHYISQGHFEITNSLNVHPMKRFSAKVEASIPIEAQTAHCCPFLSLFGYVLNQPQWSILMHNTYMSLICDKSVTTQNLAFLCYWYRKKRLHMHF